VPWQAAGASYVRDALPDKRGLGKAKITDRINRIDKIYIKNPDNPVNPVENWHERFFVSGIECER
jgi:hypothetical protein